MTRLTFNTAAAREYFESDRLNWLRLRIERGVVTLRPAANSRGDDEVIRIERRPRGIVADINEGRFSKRLMSRLFRAGLTDDQPYFLLAPAAYGWIGIDHLPGMKPPQRQAVLVVSDFETQEEASQPVIRVPAARVSVSAFNFAHWTRFLRAVNADRPVETSGWDEIQHMIQLAHETTAQKQRGRQSYARLAANRLLHAVQRRASTLLEWEERHPELRRQVSSLLKEVGIPVEETTADIIHIHKRRRRHHEVAPEIEEISIHEVAPIEDVEQVEPVVEDEPEDLPAPPRKPSRRRPRRIVPEPETEAEPIAAEAESDPLDVDVIDHPPEEEDTAAISEEPVSEEPVTEESVAEVEESVAEVEEPVTEESVAEVEESVAEVEESVEESTANDEALLNFADKMFLEQEPVEPEEFIADSDTDANEFFAQEDGETEPENDESNDQDNDNDKIVDADQDNVDAGDQDETDSEPNDTDEMEPEPDDPDGDPNEPVDQQTHPGDGDQPEIEDHETYVRRQHADTD